MLSSLVDGDGAGLPATAGDGVGVGVASMVLGAPCRRTRSPIGMPCCGRTGGVGAGGRTASCGLGFK
jgi:hypothetical protein